MESVVCCAVLAKVAMIGIHLRSQPRIELHVHTMKIKTCWLVFRDNVTIRVASKKLLAFED